MAATAEQIQQAREAGYSNEEIAQHLGYSPDEIAAFKTQAEAYGEGRRAEAQDRMSQQEANLVQGTRGWGEGAYRALEGVGQLGVAVGEQLGVVPEGTTGRYTEDAMMRRYAATGGEGIDEQMADVTEGLLLMAPWAQSARTFGMLPRLRDLTTGIGAMARGVRQGAVAGTLGMGMNETAEDQADVLTQRLFGGALGGTLGGTVAGAGAAIPAARNFITRSLRQAQTNSETVRALRNSMDVGGYSLSQRTGNPLFKRLEVQVAATRAQEFLNQQYARFAIGANHMANAFNRAAGGQPAAFDLAYRVSRAYRADRQGLFDAINRNYGARLGVALDMARQDPAKFPLPFDSIEAVTKKWADETGGVWWRKLNPGAERMAPELEALDTYLQSVRARNVALNTPGPGNANQIGTAFEGLSIEEMVRLRRSLNNMDAAYWAARDTPSGPSVEQLNMHRAVGDLRKAMDRDIDAYLQNADPNLPSVQALREFRGANEDYRLGREQIQMLDEAAGAQMFRFGTPMDAEASLRKIAGMEPRQQQLLMRTLRTADPDAIPQMQAWLARDAVNSMLNPSGAAVSGKIDPDALVKALTNRHGQVIGREIFTPTQRAQLARAIDTVRLMRNAPSNKGVIVTGVERTPEIQGTLMAIASWSEAFLTRQAIRFGGLGPVEDVLFTQRGLQALETIRNTMNAPTEATARAMAVLGSMLANPEETE